MTNFHIDEVEKEYIVLKQILYDYISGTESDLKLKVFPKGSSNGIEIPFTVLNNGLRMEFDLSPHVQPLLEYDLKIFEVIYTEGEQSQSERELYKHSFRTSQFRKFADKVATFSEQNSQGYQYIDVLNEPFDNVELSKNLIRVSLDISESSLQEIAKAQQYETYGDNYIQQYCWIDNIPKCSNCSSGGTFYSLFSNKIIYQRGYFKEYVNKVKSHLFDYVTVVIVGNNGDIPELEFYYWVLGYAWNPLTSSEVQKNRFAPTDPKARLSYFTPEGKLTSIITVGN